MQRLPIEPVSQASANQRAGRCGRVADGICIRLYSEEDFDARPDVHRPRDPAHEPGVGHPADDRHRARRHRRLPVPRPARPSRHHRRRAPAAGARRARGGRRTRPASAHRPSVGAWPACRSIPGSDAWCSRPTRMVASARCSIIAAALSIQDPRERPTDHAGGGRPAHARFADRHARTSSRIVNLWRYVREQQHELSSGPVPPDVPARVPELPARPRVAGRALPNFAGSPLTSACARTATAAEPDPIHRSLLAGLLSHIGQKDGDSREYRRRPQRHASPSSPARPWRRSRRRGSWRPSWSRPPALWAARRPASSPSGPRSSPGTS